MTGITLTFYKRWYTTTCFEIISDHHFRSSKTYLTLLEDQINVFLYSTSELLRVMNHNMKKSNLTHLYSLSISYSHLPCLPLGFLSRLFWVFQRELSLGKLKSTTNSRVKKRKLYMGKLVLVGSLPVCECGSKWVRQLFI